MSDRPSGSGSERAPQPGAPVIALPRSGRSEAPDFPAARHVQDHWNALRGARLCPERAEIDPKPLAHCLDVMFIAELVAPGVARLRLTGQQLSDLLGMDPRGMPLSVFLTAEARDELGGALEQVAKGARAVLPLRSDTGLRQPALDGVLVLLPLTDTKGQITRILGVLETRGPAGRAPRRFRLTAPVQTARDTGPALVTGKVTPPQRPAAVAPGRPLARPAAPPRFRVIQGGKA